MQIVIDIDDSTYKDIVDNGIIFDEDNSYVSTAIINGTPLPKGHGRLKDVDWIDDNCEIHHSDTDGSWCYAWRDIDNAPTIIEADKED